jgi:hypothetical protein
MICEQKPGVNINRGRTITQNSGSEQELLVTETCSTIIVVNNTSGGPLIQGLTINNPRGDVHFMPNGIWT